MFTIRMFYNRPLWRAVFGGEETLPRTYEELVACCCRAAAYRMADGRPVVPIAGALYNAPMLVQRLFSSQTQRLSYALARPGELHAGKEELALDLLAGRWSFANPAVRDGLELVHGVGQFLPGGFLQLRREDMIFLFCQGRAPMTVTGSWDAPSIRSQAPFEVGVFDVPAPDAADPRYGPNIRGVVSEAGVQTGLLFGMTKQATPAGQAQVVDFLRFLTSRDSNRHFSDASGWLPAVVGVEPRPEVRPFLPRTEGYPAGFGMDLKLDDAVAGFGTETSRVIDTNMYRLFESDAGPAAHAEAIADPLRPAVIRDFNTIHRDQWDVVTRQDTMLAACRALAQAAGAPGDAAPWQAKVNELDELQTQEEIGLAARRWKLARLGISLER